MFLMCVSPVCLIKGRELGHKSFLEMAQSQYKYDWSRSGEFHERCVWDFARLDTHTLTLVGLH